MEIRCYKCESCGKVVYDLYEEGGWIFWDDNGFRITFGRQDDGIARLFRYISDIKLQNNRIDFCSISCMLKFLFIQGSHYNRPESISLTFEEQKYKELLEDLIAFSSELFSDGIVKKKCSRKE